MPLLKYSCLRCDHAWHPRTNKKPTVCPKCHSPYYGKPKTNFLDQDEYHKKCKEELDKLLTAIIDRKVIDFDSIFKKYNTPMACLIICDLIWKYGVEHKEFDFGYAQDEISRLGGTAIYGGKK